MDFLIESSLELHCEAYIVSEICSTSLQVSYILDADCTKLLSLGFQHWSGLFRKNQTFRLARSCHLQKIDHHALFSVHNSTKTDCGSQQHVQSQPLLHNKYLFLTDQQSAQIQTRNCARRESKMNFASVISAVYLPPWLCKAQSMAANAAPWLKARIPTSI